MRVAVAILAAFIVLSSRESAQAQQNSAEAAFNAFANTCIAHRADRTAIMPLLTGAGWTRAPFEELPRSPIGRHQGGGVPITILMEQQSDSVVFKQADEPPWLYVHLFSLADGGIERRHCDVIAAGAAVDDVGALIFPGEAGEQRRQLFRSAPIAVASSGGQQFSVAVTPISERSAAAHFESMAYFAFDHSQPN